MSEYFISPDGKLYYFDGDYLQHWKYIKREKVNGKWRYYYHDDKYEDAKAKYETAKEKSDELRYRAGSTKTYSKVSEDDGTNPYRTAGKTAATKRAEKKADRAEEKTAKAKAEYIKAKEKYEKSLGLKVTKGLNKTTDAINRSVDKGREFVDKLFGKKKKSTTN